MVRSLLIVMVSKAVPSHKYRQALEESLDTIEQSKFRATVTIAPPSSYTMCVSSC
jgi:hypothetical protein